MTWGLQKKFYSIRIEKASRVATLSIKLALFNLISSPNTQQVLNAGSWEKTAISIIDQHEHGSIRSGGLDLAYLHRECRANSRRDA